MFIYLKSTCPVSSVSLSRFLRFLSCGFSWTTLYKVENTIPVKIPKIESANANIIIAYKTDAKFMSKINIESDVSLDFLENKNLIHLNDSNGLGESMFGIGFVHFPILRSFLARK